MIYQELFQSPESPNPECGQVIYPDLAGVMPTNVPTVKGDQGLVGHLKNNIITLERHCRKLNEQLAEREEFSRQVIDAVVAQTPYPPRKACTTRSKDTVIPVLTLSDLHIGEVVQANETEGFNAFNWQIAEEGLLGIVDEFLQWVDIQRGHYRIDECAVFMLGDYVSGDIHDELKATNEFPLPHQTAKAGALLGEVVRILCGRFKRVHAWQCGADNHGRLQRKPQSKQKAENNMSFLVHYICNAYVSRCHNYKAHIAEGTKLLSEVNGKKYLLQHGDGIRSVMGIPFYGIQRAKGREAVKRMMTDKGFDYFCIGHFHTPTILEGFTMVNGSLSGTSEFDHDCGRHSIPCQTAWLVHPRWGNFNWTPFYRRT